MIAEIKSALYLNWYAYISTPLLIKLFPCQNIILSFSYHLLKSDLRTFIPDIG